MASTDNIQNAFICLIYAQQQIVFAHYICLHIWLGYIETLKMLLLFLSDVYNINHHIVTGATKEIGTALTRVCLRHKAVETRMKSFTTAIMDCLIIPLQVSFFAADF